MLQWLRRLILAPPPGGPEEEIGRIPPGTAPIARDAATRDGEAWRVVLDGAAPVALFDLPIPEVYGCLIAVRARLRSDTPDGAARLELRCSLSDGGKLSAMEQENPAGGAPGWTHHEVRLHLQRGQWADRLTLELAGSGRASIRDVTVHMTPVAPGGIL